MVKLCTTLADNGFTFSICVKIQDVFEFELESTKPQNQYVKQKGDAVHLTTRAKLKGHF